MPPDVKVYAVGCAVIHEQPVALSVSLRQYSVTPTLSLAVKVVIGTVSTEDEVGMVKDVIVGSCVSETYVSVSKVIVVVADALAEILPAASRTNA